jgi:hypothetical protein
MKTLFSFLAVMALIITSSFTVNQQKQLNQSSSSVNSCFDNFRAHRQGKAGVSLTWSVSMPDIVQFSVERSYDGDFFEVIGGANANAAGTYRHKDNDVFPGRIYYRITALKADGSTESSPVEVVRIVQRG